MKECREIRGEAPPFELEELNFWIDGYSGRRWGPGNPFYETDDSIRNKLLGFINRHPTTTGEISEFLGVSKEEAAEHVEALKKAMLIKVLCLRGKDEVYAPNFVITTDSDMALIDGFIEEVGLELADRLRDHLDEIDAILEEDGADIFSRWAIITGNILDVLLLDSLTAKGAIPHRAKHYYKGCRPIYGCPWQFFGEEPYVSKATRAEINISHNTTLDFSLLLLLPYFDRKGKREEWGLTGSEMLFGIRSIVKILCRHKEPLILEKLAKRLKRPKSMAQKVDRLIEEGKFEALLEFLVEQGYLIREGDGYTVKVPRFSLNSYKRIKRMAGDVAEFLKVRLLSDLFVELYHQMTCYRNKVIIGQFRWIVVGKLIGKASSIAVEQGILPDPAKAGKEVIIWEQELPFLRKLISWAIVIFST